jgi:hypothetical protein
VVLGHRSWRRKWWCGRFGWKKAGAGGLGDARERGDALGEMERTVMAGQR